MNDVGGGVDGPAFPLSAVVAGDELRTALLLAAIDRRIGGVLLRGDKGSAKSTVVRGLAALLPDGAPFVELPLGATEDRVVGSFDVRATLGGGEFRYRPGLLEAADGGVLYVDEVNLLPDHLVDLLLDVAASGVVRVERDGLSEARPARFVLVGSMNPEEGELRPQLLDRFGLAVGVQAPRDPADRAEAVRRRLAFDADPEGFAARWADRERAMGERLASTVPAALPEAVAQEVAELCASAGAEGLRADLVVCRAACALAGWQGRLATTIDDVLAVAPLALVHRRRTPWAPFEPPPPTGGSKGEQKGQAKDELDVRPGSADSSEPVGEPEGSGLASDGAESGVKDSLDSFDHPPTPPVSVLPVVGPSARRRRTGPAIEGPRGRLVSSRPSGPEGPRSVHAAATVAAAAVRQVEPGPMVLVESDLREPVRHEVPSTLVVLVVDASGSMGARLRLEAARAAVVALLVDAYQRRDRVALVTFRGEAAETVLRPTGSTEIARARMGELEMGGERPFAAGIREGLAVAASRRRGADQPLLVVVSDGRATAAAGREDPLAAALRAAAEVRAAGIQALVVDVESGPNRLGLASRVAEAMGAQRVAVGDLTGHALAHTVRSALVAGTSR